MHINAITRQRPARANLRSNLELLLLFMDVISAALCIFRKEGLCSEGHDHGDDHHNGHTH